MEISSTKIYVTCIHVCVIVQKAMFMKHVAAKIASYKESYQTLRARYHPQFSLLLSVPSLALAQSNPRLPKCSWSIALSTTAKFPRYTLSQLYIGAVMS